MPSPKDGMERIFLDANVLFSAAYKPSTRLRLLWALPSVKLFSSEYAVQEARTNLERLRPSSIEDFEQLLQGLKQVSLSNLAPLPPSISLVEKDAPILQAAIAAKATHLLTGDVKHFGHLFSSTVEGVLILRPAEYLKGKD